MSETSPCLIVALDFDDKKECLDLVDQLDPMYCRLKVGKQLFTSFGPSIVESLQLKGFDVFLDLKFHDIPVTVAKAVKASANLGVWMVNVHASGGVRMMEAAKESLIGFQCAPLLIGVTVLTSMSAEDLLQTGVTRSLDDQVLSLARMADASGLDGLVCSAKETGLIGKQVSKTLRLVTPGIRPEGCDIQDQRRTMTPSEAIINGSHYLVVGRPITQAPKPAELCRAIADEILAAKLQVSKVEALKTKALKTEPLKVPPLGSGQ